MNFLLVTPSYTDEAVYGGIATYTENLAEPLAAAGHQVVVLCRSLTSKFEAKRINGVCLVKVPCPRNRLLDRLSPHGQWSLRAYLAIRRLHQKLPFDAVEFPNWEGPGLLHLALAGSERAVTRLHTPFFESLELNRSGDRPLPWERRLLAHEKTAVCLSPHITCSTRHHAAFVAGRYGLPDRRVTIVPLGIKIPQSPLHPRSPKESGGSVQILFLSRLERRKGIDVFLEAVPRILAEFPKTRFVVVGDDRKGAPGNLPYKDYFSQSFPECAGQVHFTGHVSPVELDLLFAQSDIFAVPSRYESFGLIYVEAMSRGLPVIGGNAGGIPEVIADGETGFLVSPDSVEDFAEKLLLLCRRPELRGQLGDAAARLARRKFDRDIMARRTLCLYQSFHGAARAD